MRILFLDDNDARCAWANRELGVGNTLMLANTAYEAIKWLKFGDPDDQSDTVSFDEVYLDHDLGGEVYVDPSRSDTGSEVVRWIAENKPKIKEIIVHTMNTPVGHEMVRALRLAGYKARYRSFYRMAQGAGW